MPTSAKLRHWLLARTTPVNALWPLRPTPAMLWGRLLRALALTQGPTTAHLPFTQKPKSSGTSTTLQSKYALADQTLPTTNLTTGVTLITPILPSQETQCG